MQKNTFLILAAIITLTFACKNPSDKTENKIISASEITKGDKLGSFTINEVDYSNGIFTAKFSDEIEIEGLLAFEVSPTAIAIEFKLFDVVIKFEESEIDLSTINSVYINNYQEITKFIPLDWREESTSDNWKLKEEKNKTIKIKIKIRDIVLTNDGPYTISANISNVSSFDGIENPEPVNELMIAKLNSIVLSTDGAWYDFDDKSGNSHLFFDDGNINVHNFFSDIELNTSDHKFQNILLEITWKTDTSSFLNKGTGKYEDREVKVITSIKKAAK